MAGARDSKGTQWEWGSWGAPQAPSMGSGAMPRPTKGFLVFQSRQTGISWNLLRPSSKGAGRKPPCTPLNPPVTSTGLLTTSRVPPLALVITCRHTSALNSINSHHGLVDIHIKALISHYCRLHSRRWLSGSARQTGQQSWPGHVTWMTHWSIKFHE